MSGNSNWVDDAVAEIDVTKDVDLGHLHLNEAFDDLLTQITESNRSHEVVPIRRRRLPGKAATIGIAAVLLCSAGAAAAVKGGALTGLFGKPGSTENDTSEYVLATSSGFPAVVRQNFEQLLSEGLRFAPGTNTHRVLNDFVSQHQAGIRKLESGNSALAKSLRSHGELVQITGIKGTFAGLAQCSWQEYWVQAYESGDTAERNAAVQGMAALDNVVTVTPSKTGTFSGSIMAETNRKRTLLQYVREMKHGDFSLLKQYTNVQCEGSTE
jgi:hypothetical protein